MSLTIIEYLTNADCFIDRYYTKPRMDTNYSTIAACPRRAAAHRSKLEIIADPEPVVPTISLAGEGAIAATNLGGTDPPFLLKPGEGWRGFFLTTRNSYWQASGHALELLITFPEGRQRLRSRGRGLKLPASISASIFSSAFSCLPPGEKSSSISLSQAILSQRAMCAANFASSTADNLSTASSSSARLITKQEPRGFHFQSPAIAS